MKYVISALVSNQAGVLSRISGLFARRGFNINSLAVGETEDAAVSRMTIIVDGDDYMVGQVEKQLNKQIDVIKVKRLEGITTQRELLLVKITAQAPQRREIIDITQITGAKIVDLSTGTMTLEICDRPDKIEIFLSLLEPYQIKEIARTGVIALEKGVHTIGKD